LQICAIVVFFNWYSHFVVEAKLNELLSDPDQFADFSGLASL
jgi:hypothetical protein